MQPPYSPDTVNQTVSYNGKTYRGNPGQGWQDISAESAQNDANAKIDAQNAATKAANDARFASNKQELGDFITSYQNAVPNIINQTSNKYQLPQLAATASALGTRTNDIAGNLTGEGAGGYASAGQVDKAVQTNYLPRWGQAVNNLQTGTTLAQNEENQLETPYTTQANLLIQRQAQETTGYTAEQAAQLNSLVAQLQAGVTLTTDQQDNAEKLAAAEEDYNAAVDAAKIKNQAPQNVQKGTYIYDPVSQTAHPVA